jgi:hypothetical protein
MIFIKSELCVKSIANFLCAGFNKGTVQSLKHIQRRSIYSTVWLCKTGSNIPTEPPNTGVNKGRSSSKGAGKDNHFCCPKCGNPCTNVETFVCMHLQTRNDEIFAILTLILL